MNVSDVFVAMLFGFPEAFVSMLVSVIGIITEKFWLVIAGAILFVPFSYYLSGAPGLAGLPILLPGFLVGSALAVRGRNRLWAWLLLAPSALAILWILGSVILSTGTTSPGL